MKNKLILASTSAYRKALLSRLGILFEVQPPQCDEDLLKREFSGTPQELSEFLALEKAKSISHSMEPEMDACVIGGDQLLEFENQIFGKPHTHTQAHKMLSRFQGKTHTLVTSMAILSFKPDLQSPNSVIFTNRTQLTMKKLSPQQIQNYLSKDTPYDCAGGYKIEKSGIGLFEHIETDDFTAIEGIPLLQLSKVLKTFGFESFQS